MQRADFDRVAGVYQLLEKAVFRSALQKTRCGFLDALPCQGKVLVLGEGDGRFLKAAVEAKKELRFVAIDPSQAMQATARGRLLPEERERVEFVHARVEDWLEGDARPAGEAFDAVVTHFFLDCFSNQELQSLVPRLASRLRPGGVWVVSEFRTPSAPWWWRMAGRGLIAVMYGFFRITAGLQATELPDHRKPLREAGLVLPADAERVALRGLLASELWHVPSCD